MGDRLAARHLALGALDIDMDPLMVAGRIGEFVDLLLGHREPVADPDFLPLIGLEIAGAFDFQHSGPPRFVKLTEIASPRNGAQARSPGVAMTTKEASAQAGPVPIQPMG